MTKTYKSVEGKLSLDLTLRSACEALLVNRRQQFPNCLLYALQDSRADKKCEFQKYI